MGDPAADAWLAGSLAGGIDGQLDVHDAVASDLYAYAWFLLAPGRHAAEDGPAEAVRDALLVAGETVGELTDPTLARAWLYALTRNECLRLASRRPAAQPSAQAEAAELAGRHGLAPPEIGAVLGPAAGLAPDAGPLVPVEAPPGWLRDELAAALGVEGAGVRAELARRAHPYDPDGFPVPIDNRRLSGRALAWSAAAVVLLALALLVMLPGARAGTPPGPALVAAVPAGVPATSAIAPLPTLPATPFADTSTSAAPRPQSAPDRGADRRPASTAPAGQPATRLQTDGAGGSSERWPPTALLVSWQPVGDCAGDWTAELQVRAYGASQSDIAQMTASVTGGAAARTVSLSWDGASWQGELAGLPTGREVSVTVRAAAADGSTVREVTRQLAHDC